MEILISFYDNALIYYPNAFFAVLFILFIISILGVIFVGIKIIILWKKIKKIKKIIEEIKSNLKKIKRIKREEGSRTPFAQIIRAFFERRKTFLVSILGFLMIFLSHTIKFAFVGINTALEYIESQAEKIAKKIGEEIFIKE